MKKIIIVLFVLFSLGSCRMVYDVIDDTTYELLENVEFYDFAEYDLSNINNFYQISAWIRHHVYYKADNIEEFYTVQQTMEMGYADCEDFSALFMNIAYLTLGIKMDMVIVDKAVVRTVVEGGRGNHIVVRYDGRNYGAQTGQICSDQEVMYLYTFDEVFPDAPEVDIRWEMITAVPMSSKPPVKVTRIEKRVLIEP